MALFSHLVKEASVIQRISPKWVLHLSPSQLNFYTVSAGSNKISTVGQMSKVELEDSFRCARGI